ncbi:MAG: acyltransferase [Eubacteriales bacterium]|nr:acyltransferase [Eubacteriales bacterium]
MKPLILVLHNFIKIRLKAICADANVNVAPVELLSRNTKLVFKKNSTVILGKNIVSDGRCVMIVDEGGRLEIGSRVYMNENSMISCKGRIAIGEGCKFGPNVNIFDNNHGFNYKEGVSETHTKGDIVIGKGCWLGANVVVLKGAKIGDNCLIGAGCVISEEIPAGSLVMQNRELIIKPLRKD